MLETIDLDKKISREEYRKIAAELSIRISVLQRAVKEAGVPVIIAFEGLDGAGKGSRINDLIQAIDPRNFWVHPIRKPTEDEKLRPFLWRFWTKTPARGRIAIFDQSWYTQHIEKRVSGKISEEEGVLALRDIGAFERQLADSGAVIIKFFLHIDKNEQKKRFKKLEANKSTAWRITKKDWKHHKLYGEYLGVVDDMIGKTDFEYAPWTVVEAMDGRFANVKIMQTFINAVERGIGKGGAQKKMAPAALTAPPVENLNSSILARVDLSLSLSRDEYAAKLDDRQERLRELEHEIYMRRIPLIILYEGWDAAGKGGNIRRVIQEMDPRGYEVIPVAAPNDIESAHHYLWRFWNYIPKAGHITIFDRTWYGRVLVERVEGFCPEGDWKRAYREINEMEEHLVNYGAVLVKFWLQIDRDEQLRRFEERKSIPHKNWKITEEDWRNREKWDNYRAAVDEMLFRTSTPSAPWTIVESNSKYFARIKTMETIIATLERKLEGG
ncbi:MAG: polyphosphate:AMP phosphotransferase [Spirochaetes bacterium]|nr:MAG: polyphosphate:AMP phosphotransferase [Spirochaetota bacterium]